MSDCYYFAIIVAKCVQAEEHSLHKGRALSFKTRIHVVEYIKLFKIDERIMLHERQKDLITLKLMAPLQLTSKALNT